MDHVDQAVYDVIHNSDISTKDIAQRLGMSHQVLINKANPQQEFHKMTLREALAIQLITGNHGIHRAVETELGVSENKPVLKNLLESVLVASKEHGDVVREVQQAMEDGRFTLREKEKCQKEIDDAMKALTELRQAVISHR
ncbi:putative bacteriophage protein [gamma proteobacterium IMCC1989]|nr:putative bacteriophage protein [gamma proteobacterium IMCC1989]